MLKEENKTTMGKNKKKAIIISSIAILLVMIAAVLVYFLALKPAYEEAVVQYDKVSPDYKQATIAFSDKCAEIEAKNAELQTAIDTLQSVIDLGEKPYDATKITDANSAINNGKIALVSIPTWDKAMPKESSEYNFLQTNKMKEEISSITAATTELNELTNSLQIPDYTEVIAGIGDAQSKLERSIKQMKQVTCPDESFVLQRVTNIRDAAGMIDVISLTEDNDPENYIGKAGWYTVKVVFHHKDVEHYGLDNGLLTLNEVGNPAGGCIEVYRTEEDVQRRADELKSQEGTVRSPGARAICGTVLVRVSDDLKASYQQELLELIVAELIRLED